MTVEDFITALGVKILKTGLVHEWGGLCYLKTSTDNIAVGVGITGALHGPTTKKSVAFAELKGITSGFADQSNQERFVYEIIIHHYATRKAGSKFVSNTYTIGMALYRALTALYGTEYASVKMVGENDAHVEYSRIRVLYDAYINDCLPTDIKINELCC